jgi:hypothetical protein
MGSEDREGLDVERWEDEVDSLPKEQTVNLCVEESRLLA